MLRSLLARVSLGVRSQICGRIREAHGGTLFLDEIGDMPLAMQARLLRVLQDREVTPLGGGAAVAVDFRLLCATHQRLKDEVAAGRFREDLYYRLNGLTMSLPALRERSDLAELVARLLKAEAPERALRVDDEVMAFFAHYRWPGNVRQLANVVRTGVALLDDGEDALTMKQVGDEVREAPGAASLEPASAPPPSDDLRQLAETRIRETLAAVGGNVSEAARRLGVSRNTLYRRLRG